MIKIAEVEGIENISFRLYLIDIKKSGYILTKLIYSSLVYE